MAFVRSLAESVNSILTMSYHQKEQELEILCICSQFVDDQVLGRCGDRAYSCCGWLGGHYL